MFSVHDRSATGKPYGWCTVLKLGHLKLYKVAGIEVLPKFSSEPLFALSFSDSMAGEPGHPAEIRIAPRAQESVGTFMEFVVFESLIASRARRRRPPIELSSYSSVLSESL